jgi:hypothetical protein
MNKNEYKVKDTVAINRSQKVAPVPSAGFGICQEV